MPVYVYKTSLSGPRGGTLKGWHKLVADSPGELRAMLEKLNLNSYYIHLSGGTMEYFHLTSAGREKAISLGAIPLTEEDGAERHARLYEAEYGHRPEQ